MGGAVVCGVISGDSFQSACPVVLHTMSRTTSLDVAAGRRIRALRVLRGWRQSDLASAARVTRKTIWRAERGLPILPVTSEAIARALGVELTARHQTVGVTE